MYALDDLRSFAAIAERGGITAAAEAQGLSPATVSHRLAKLEGHLGVVLFHRSSRSVRLSDEGMAFLARVGPILDALDEAETEVSGRGGLRGHLRVTLAPWVLSRFLLPKLDGFAEAHPDLVLEFLAVDRYVNLVEERQDCAIRVGALSDSSDLVRKLADNHRILCAAPGYVTRHGAPEGQADLARHRCIVLPWQRDWGLGRMTGALVVSNSDSLTEAAVCGLGIALKSRLAVARELARGDLVEVLPGCLPEAAAPISILRPATGQGVRKVEAFAQFAVACFREGVVA